MVAQASACEGSLEVLGAQHVRAVAAQRESAALAACHPPNLQRHAVERLLARRRRWRHLEVCQTGAPAACDAACEGRVEWAFDQGVKRELWVEQQLIHLGARQQRGAIAVGYAGGVAHGSGDFGHQANHGDTHDQGGHHHFEQRESALPASRLALLLHGDSGCSISVTPVRGFSRTMRRAPRRLAISMPMRGGTPPGWNRNRRGSSVGSSRAGQTACTAMPGGRINRFKKAASGDRMVTVFSLMEMDSSMACCRRSARLAATFMKAATDRAPAARRSFSMPAMVLGKERPTIREMMASTTIISIRVTPRHTTGLETRCRRGPPPHKSLFPVGDIGIDSLTAGLAVGAVADEVGLFTVLSGVPVDIRVLPRVQRDVFFQIGP